MSYKFDTPQPVTPGPMIHPGPFIHHELLDPYGLSVSDAADRLGVDALALEKVLAGKGALSADLAYRLEDLFGIDADLLIDWQRAHERDRDGPLRALHKERISRLPQPV